MPFIPHTEEDLRVMLACVGVRDLAALFEDIPPQLKPKSFVLPEGLSEMETCAHFERLADKNEELAACFLGAGFYDHHIPKAVDALAGRSEFVTAYTPYQAECSQGTLQAIFEYQTAVTRLFNMDCANASVYDGGSALFEAAMMAIRQTKRRKLVVDETLNPIWRIMLNSYTANLDLDILTVPQQDGRSDMRALKTETDADCAAVFVQNPNFFGAVQDFSDLFAHAKTVRALSVISVYPVMQAVLKTPGEMGADAAVADGQSLGMPLTFGGPYLGIMTCKKELIRQFPGRIAGRTSDLEGKTGYVLTLQAREQHIRRAKATSNICSNQALCALRSLVHLCLLGPLGLARAAELGMEKAREAATRLCKLPGVT
ncbi:MAG: aminomethyl-transferring glycine dehydrogenase subunit GcvPA, partial [Desulfovibrionaceae bacterium]|nr:aminomethyl-transferring glycine dehydrogenase subunit GcvPA [Desulfovibrionaceae bacterium]